MLLKLLATYHACLLEIRDMNESPTVKKQHEVGARMVLHKYAEANLPKGLNGIKSSILNCLINHSYAVVFGPSDEELKDGLFTNQERIDLEALLEAE